MQTSNRKTVSQQFANDFEAIATRYNLRELGEYETAKSAARRDIESAEICFTAMAGEMCYPADMDAKKALESMKAKEAA